MLLKHLTHISHTSNPDTLFPMWKMGDPRDMKVRCRLDVQATSNPCQVLSGGAFQTYWVRCWSKMTSDK